MKMTRISKNGPWKNRVEYRYPTEVSTRIVPLRHLKIWPEKLKIFSATLLFWGEILGVLVRYLWSAAREMSAQFLKPIGMKQINALRQNSCAECYMPRPVANSLALAPNSDLDFHSCISLLFLKVSVYLSCHLCSEGWVVIFWFYKLTLAPWIRNASHVINQDLDSRFNPHLVSSAGIRQLHKCSSINSW